MKYLYAIIRHIWPRKPQSRWQVIREIRIWDEERPNAKHPAQIRYVLQDQFGNLRNHIADQ